MKSIVRGAYNKTSVSYMIATMMKEGCYYSAGAIAKRLKLKQNINDVKRVLGWWRSWGWVEVRLQRRRGRKRKITLYRLTDEGLRVLKTNPELKIN